MSSVENSAWLTAIVIRVLVRPGRNTASAVGTAANTPVPSTESWHYSIGHWVEDDPAVGDGAFSSAGAFGFYPWIDASKTYYGVLAREAIELGEPVMAAAILRDVEEQIGQAQTDEIARRVRRRRRRQRALCELCGTGFDWPGELAEHRLRVHGKETGGAS